MATLVVAAAAAVLAVSVGASESGSPGAVTSSTVPSTTIEVTTTVVPTTTAPPTTTTLAPTTTVAVPPPSLDQSDAAAIVVLQERLIELRYWLGEPDGTMGRATKQAVLAFQKAEGLERDGQPGPATMERLTAASTPQPSSLADGVEIDLARQLLFLVHDGEVVWVINTSTGTSRTPTPRGEFAVDRQIDGMRHAPLGDLYRPKYFNRGIAVHGSPSIPGYPASHGCARVSNAAMDFLWSSGLIEVGTPVRVV
ncbi:MAG: L,D-transpeptidase family protein [Actinomycetota bacterium]|nr:L,D-transpeptidase family protein [Actinomycetota bacterium]